ncbi:MAG: protoporphyrinogen oxidase HemJ [Rickettsiales bacterium]|nr:protoporphyrinogen oxidase HemJ [Rickettsiales bacterium]
MELYEIIKAFHIISIIAWMAGLLYLPRIFVYHCQVEYDSQASQIFEKMEIRLMKIIMNPSMIITIILGLYLAYQIGFEQKWIHLKITLVILLAIFHMFLARCRKNFAKNQNNYSEKFYRIINEVPTLLMIIIVFLVILKPF